MRSILLATAFTVIAASASAAPVVHGIDKDGMDLSAPPGDDFNGYANGAWLKKTEIPADQAGWGVFTILREQASKRTADLIEGAAKKTPAAGSVEQKIGDFYASFMDEAGIEAKGLAPLKPDMDRIAAIKNKHDLARVIGETLRQDVDPLNNTNFYTENLFGIWVAPGYDDSEHYTPYLLQGGLGLPDRDYYLADNPKMAQTREAYKAHIEAMLKLAGVADAHTKAARIFDLETAIAKAHWTIDESQDLPKTNNPWATADFAKKAPGFDWQAFFAGAGLDKKKMFIAYQASALTGIANVVADTQVDAWKDYLTFHLINHYASVLPKAFVDQRFDFYGKTLTGTPQLRARWKRAVDATNAALGDAVGQIYAAHYFAPEAKAAAQAMVKNIVDAFGRRIDRLDWMTPATKAKAKEKLFALYVGIGYPDKWRDYAGFEVVRGDALGNLKRSERFDYHYSVDRIGKAPDRTEWSMTPQTVNAVNLPLQIALNFPAAILEKPFFDPKADPVVNYGAIGGVIGHEISHAFDDQGALFDAKGRLANWWTKEDFAHFQASGAKLAAQYSAYCPFQDLCVKGTQTLGENIADVAGLSASFDGWRESLHGKPAKKDRGFTGEQQFFLSYGQSRRQKSRDAALRQQIATDVHAPAMYRALAVRNLDGWYDAFGVKPGQKLYLAPADRVQVW